MQCEGCEEEPSTPARNLAELLRELGPEAASTLLGAVAAKCPGAKTLSELLEDEATCAQLLEQLRLVSSMPENAASRWGDAVAAHECTNLLKCLVGHARVQPHVLDALRERLEAAKRAATTKRARTDAVLTLSLVADKVAVCIVPSAHAGMSYRRVQYVVSQGVDSMYIQTYRLE